MLDRDDDILPVDDTNTQDDGNDIDTTQINLYDKIDETTC